VTPDVDPYAEWRALVARRERAYVDRRCTIHATWQRLAADGVTWEWEDEPAAYRWTGPGGNEELLCVSCCAAWRANAAADPEMLPRRVELLTTRH
jgi:hypothetical protein